MCAFYDDLVGARFSDQHFLAGIRRSAAGQSISGAAIAIWIALNAMGCVIADLDAIADAE